MTAESTGIKISRSSPKKHPNLDREQQAIPAGCFSGFMKRRRFLLSTPGGTIEKTPQRKPGDGIVSNHTRDGDVWTKALPDGNTTAVRVDKGSGRLGFADEFDHVHKEIVPSHRVRRGNYRPRNVLHKLDDQGFIKNSDEWIPLHITYRYGKRSLSK